MRTQSHRLSARRVWPILIVGLAALLTFQTQQMVTAGGKLPAEEFTISGPFQHQNLTVFLIHGKDRVKPGRLLTLQEALAQNKAVVHETQRVNELEVENISEDVEVFIQSGDIVKGGQQDRLISFDLLLPPKSGKIAVVSCCVEQGRWQQRGKETAVRFTSSRGQLPSKTLKLHGGTYGQFAGGQGGGGQGGGLQGGQGGGLGGLQGGQGGGGQFTGQFGGQFGGQFSGQFGGQLGGGQGGGFQGGVWMEVGQVQSKLRSKLGVEVQSKESESSLQLTLEHPKVRQATEKYIQQLSKAVEGRKDVIGYAFAINGTINSIEIYGSAELFGKLWPKLLKANALEAFIDREESFPSSGVKVEDIQAVMRDAEQAKAIERDISKRVRIIMRDTEKNVLVETRDREKAVWLHRSYLTK